jgi:hypothetical protein
MIEWTAKKKRKTEEICEEEEEGEVEGIWV